MTTAALRQIARTTAQAIAPAGEVLVDWHLVAKVWAFLMIGAYVMAA